MGGRARYSTDAGNYRVVPAAVCFPQSTEDVLAILAACRAHNVPVTSRGGGTSCAGNACGPGVVIDFTRHLNRVISIDPEARTALVEPGCIQATLQAAAAPYGLRFGPDPSSMNRASIGGMVGNNACGPHATAWGRTSDNVVALDCVDGLGRRFTATLSHDVGLPEVPGLADLVEGNLALIRTELGRFGRQVSGFSLEHLTPEGKRNLAAMLVGTEGTLVTVLAVTVRLVPLPTAPVLVALGYPSMIEAADDVPTLLRHKPLAAEGLDAQLVEVVRQHKGPGAVPPLPEGQGWMMVEMGGDSAEDSLARAHALAADAHTDAVAVYPPGDEATALWRIRADGAGLGGRTPYNPETGEGNAPAWPGLEDAAVPPENLGRYLRDFTALMSEYGIDGLLYGHFGDGCVHVRLDMPLETDEGVAHSRRFMEEAAKICASYGGSISGEHGDGRSRSELLRFMYSPDMLDLFAQVKALFDPRNLLNPGVLTAPMSAAVAAQRKAERLSQLPPAQADQPAQTPAAAPHQDPQPGVDLLDEYLRRPAATPMPATRGFAFHEDGGDFTTAVHRCTGVGKCRANMPGTFMCPSYAATGEEKDVTRGRARILQEAANGRLVTSLAGPEVAEALDLCLACKACSSDCPAGVDMAKYRSEILYRRYQGKLRPASHYMLGWLPRWGRLSARVPGVAALGNLMLGIEPIRRLFFRTFGMDVRRQMAPLQYGTFSSWARAQGLKAEAAATSGGGPRYVVLWADSFSQTLESEGAKSLVRVLQANGFTVLIPPDACCGLTWITTGQLETARHKLEELLGVLGPYAANGIPIVGVEPSCTAVLRDDLVDLLPNDPRAHAVKAATRTLAEVLSEVPAEQRSLPDLTGVEVVAQPHCHHYSVMGWAADRALLASLGATVTELSGCCGLAGNFGMEQGHYEMSVAVAERSLLPALREHPDAVYLADGFSCRTQARQLADRDGVHLATLLAGAGDRTLSQP
ncbi:FAD-binding and (Fe-S)-binding domain-containing protein [Schaalia sp. Marseille-Q2122]|uniref:FAD-binding and (Fe-S)-binding domain-containing protein n=1 Tax=Schaalia sp. Marseille-Q2122 TaxID=2736604 RepID=UPI0020CA8E35|nr:FAD-binding and (Fe-S)-binding domain-containing protein [Schaalia sp. Marseille-Q2122]